jgi:hypothetical protein
MDKEELAAQRALELAEIQQQEVALQRRRQKLHSGETK